MVSLILPDNGTTEIRVASKDLRIWRERSVTLTNSGTNYDPNAVRLNDLVKIDDQTAGLVFHMDRVDMHILTCHSTVVKMRANTALKVVKFDVEPRIYDRLSEPMKVKFIPQINSTYILIFNN